MGHAIGRETIHLIQPKAVYHNSDILLAGESTISRKTTTQELGQTFYDRERWLPNETSPERLIENLSKKPEGYVWLGEFSKLLKGIKGHGYMATMAETYNDLFNCPEHYSRDLAKGTFTCENVYLNLHSTITPEVLKENITSEMFHGGFLPRWLIVHDKPTPKPRGRLPFNVLQMGEILKTITDGIIKMEKDVYFELSDEALAYFNEIEKKVIYDDGYNAVGAFAGRYENYIIAFADLYLLSDAIGKAIDQSADFDKLTVRQLGQLVELKELVNNNTSTNSYNSKNPPNLPKYAPNWKASSKYQCIVPKKYVERAFEFVKPCLDYVRELAIYIDMDEPTAKTREYIKKHKKVYRAQLLQGTGLNSKALDNAIDTLFEREEIDRGEKETRCVGKRIYERRPYVWIGKD